MKKLTKKKKEGIDDQLKKSEAFLKIKENWSNTTSSWNGNLKTHYVTQETLEREKRKLDEKLKGGVLGNFITANGAIKGLTSSGGVGYIFVQCIRANLILFFLKIFTAGIIVSMEFIPVLNIIGFLNFATCSIRG